uniref:DUF7804 domain-containing protein n=1 Tax=Oryza punctata TaxID=4537 RepID=A0A0E0KIR8_ORYPU
MRESIAEIVRHIGEAPFLVHLFNDDDGGGGSGRGGAGRVTVRRETASAESWPDVRRRWGAGGMRRPDGIILVEQIAAAVEDGASAGAGAAEAARQVWGLVVQARGMECASCYVLDTCRVRSSRGSAPTSASPGRSVSATLSSSSSATPGSTASPAAGSHRHRHRRRRVLMY